MTSEGFTRKLTAILSTDVAHYSRLMQEDEAATVKKPVEAYKVLMAPKVTRKKGAGLKQGAGRSMSLTE